MPILLLFCLQLINKIVFLNIHSSIYVLLFVFFFANNSIDNQFYLLFCDVLKWLIIILK